jgi:transposase
MAHSETKIHGDDKLSNTTFVTDIQHFFANQAYAHSHETSISVRIFARERLIDALETYRLRGRRLRGQRLLSKAPFGHWKTQTFITGLQCDALTAPFVIDASMDRRIFETYVETQLAPTLRPGDIVVLDNLPAHKSAAAEQAVRAIGAWLLFLPPYSPDLNPIEMAFAKLKALLRARAVRTIDALWCAIGEICDLFSPQECQNYFHAADASGRVIGVQKLASGLTELRHVFCYEDVTWSPSIPR